MKDLRDTTLPKLEGVIVDRLFLEYHQNTPWAQAKVAAGLHLNPQAMAYMRREIDERNLREKLYQEQLKKDLNRGANKNDGQQGEGADLPADAAPGPSTGDSKLA